MLTINDFFTFLQFLRKTIDGEDTDSLSLTDFEESRILNERDVSKLLFEKTFDQKTFNTNDWKMIRRLLIDWYATFRNIITTAKDLRDIRSMGIEDVQELFNSFGFTINTRNMSYLGRINFMLDLVNLYKIKGTPLSLKRALEYFSLTGTYDISEYWVDFNKSNDIVFKPKSIFEDQYSPWRTLTFAEMTSNDPHWFLTENQIKQLHSINPPGLPSKSPYFLASPYYNLTKLSGMLSILVREVNDQYATWLSTGDLSGYPTNTVTDYGSYTIMETYLGAVYCMKKYYDMTILDTTSPYEFIKYSVDSTTYNTLTVLNTWESLTGTRINSRSELANVLLGLENFKDSFGPGYVPYLFYDSGTHIDNIISIVNSSLKSIIDDAFSGGKNWEVTGAFFNILDIRIQRYNLSQNFPSLFSTLFRRTVSSEVWEEVVNFFKPYKARYVSMGDAVFVVDDSRDTFFMDDESGEITRSAFFMDYMVGNSFSCIYDSDPIAPRHTYDCGSYYDIGSYVDYDFQITKN